MRNLFFKLVLFISIYGSSSNNSMYQLCKDAKDRLFLYNANLKANFENIFRIGLCTEEEILKEAVDKMAFKEEKYPKDEIISLLYGAEPDSYAINSQLVLKMLLQNKLFLKEVNLISNNIEGRIRLLRVFIDFCQTLNNNNIFTYLLGDTYLMCKNIGRIIDDPNLVRNLLPLVEQIGHKMCYCINAYSETTAWMQAGTVESMRSLFIRKIQNLHEDDVAVEFKNRFEDFTFSVSLFQHTLDHTLAVNIKQDKMEVENEILLDIFYKIYQNIYIMNDFVDLFRLLPLLFDDECSARGILASSWRIIYTHLLRNKNNFSQTTAFDYRNLLEALNRLISKLAMTTQNADFHDSKCGKFANDFNNAIYDIQKEKHSTGASTHPPDLQKFSIEPSTEEIIGSLSYIIRALKEDPILFVTASVKDKYLAFKSMIKSFKYNRMLISFLRFLALGLLAVDTLLLLYLGYLYLFPVNRT